GARMARWRGRAGGARDTSNEGASAHGAPSTAGLARARGPERVRRPRRAAPIPRRGRRGAAHGRPRGSPRGNAPAERSRHDRRRELAPAGSRVLRAFPRAPRGDEYATSGRCAPLDPTPMTTTPPTHAASLLRPEDVYLFNEGTHARLYERLGAHPAEVDGTPGFTFAVWAP